MTKPRNNEDGLLAAHLAKRLTAYSAAAGLVLAMSPQAESAIHWFHPSTPFEVDHSHTKTIDMDNDGTGDISFGLQPMGKTFWSLAVNRKNAAGRFDGTGRLVRRLEKGSMVTPSLDADAAVLMNERYFTTCYPANGTNTSIICRWWTVWGDGAFNKEAKGYVGVKFRGGSGKDYNGWVHFTGGNDPADLSGTIDEWAYEDSGGAIKAGAVTSQAAHAFLSDLSGNGSPELALLQVTQGSSFGGSVLIRDIATGDEIRQVQCLGPLFRPVSMARISNVDGNGNPALAILGVRENAAKEILAVRVELRNPASGELIRNIGFSKGCRPVALRWLNRDMNGSGVGELAVLGTHPDGGRSMVEIRDLLTGALVKRITVGPDSTVESIGLSYSNDLNGNGSQELVVLQRKAATQVSHLKVVDTGTGRTIKTIPCLSESWIPVDIASIGDLNGNGSLEQGVLARSATGEKVVVKIMDLRAGKALRNVSFNSAFLPQKLAAGDINGDGVYDLGVLGINLLDATTGIEIRDPVTRSLIKTILIP